MISALRFLSAPIGTAVLTWLLLRYALETPDCNPVSEISQDLMCETRAGFEVPSSFDATAVATVAAAVLGVIAGFVAELIQSD